MELQVGATIKYGTEDDAILATILVVDPPAAAPSRGQMELLGGNLIYSCACSTLPVRGQV